jgi:hypothetical protein
MPMVLLGPSKSFSSGLLVMPYGSVIGIQPPSHGPIKDAHGPSRSLKSKSHGPKKDTLSPSRSLKSKSHRPMKDAHGPSRSIKSMSHGPIEDAHGPSMSLKRPVPWAACNGPWVSYSPLISVSWSNKRCPWFF